MNRWQLILMLVAPQLETASRLLASKDPDNVGVDDKVAAILHYAYVAVNAVLSDQPVPALPEALKK